MKYKQSEVKQEQIEWRRDKVLDLSSMGHTEMEIAKVLQVCCATVHRELPYLCR
jgi:DNA-binding NarL/FixJ family response regulator